MLLFADQPARRRAADHPSQVPSVKRVVLVILENTDASVAETLPFIGRLAARGALLRNDHSIGHPSQPNDLAAGALPNFALYIPDDQHNGHDSGPFAADAWLQSRFAPLLDDPRFMDGTLFIVLYDESVAPNDLRIISVFVGSMVRAGVVAT